MEIFFGFKMVDYMLLADNLFPYVVTTSERGVVILQRLLYPSPTSGYLVVVFLFEEIV